MTNKEVIEACVQKAIDNGWGGFHSCAVTSKKSRLTIHLKWGENGSDSVTWDWAMFDFGFAKAFWGEEKRKVFVAFSEAPNDTYVGSEPAWKHQIKGLAVSKDRIEYFRKWLKENEE